MGVDKIIISVMVVLSLKLAMVHQRGDIHWAPLYGQVDLELRKESRLL